MIDTQALRKKILDAAIRGKLTQQLPEDGNAEDLYKQIQSEKKKLIREGKLKKDKPLPEVDDKDVPFKIPENWKWGRLGHLVSIFGRIGFRGYTKQDITDEGNGALSLSPGNITPSGKMNFSKCTYITWEKYYESPEIQVQEGDIILVKTGSSYGKSCIVEKLPCESTLNPQLVVLKNILINQYYLSLTLRTPCSLSQFRSYVLGTATPTFSQEMLSKLFIPIPPLSEQKRIVAKIESIFSKLDLIEDEQKKLANNSISLRNKLVELGIRGKLTAQLASDGDAETLYADIQKEKQRLIKEGKIKKEKPLPEITEDDIPFDIPESWKWMRLGECGSWGAGATPARNDSRNYLNGTIPWLKTGDLNDSVINNVPEFITEYAFNTSSVRLNPVGSVLIAMYGATIGKLGILAIEATTNQACCACIPFSGVYNWFLYYVLLAYRGRFIEKGAGGAQPNISKEKIIMTEFPLPPLAEQKRIVEKLEQLLPLCDSMSKDIAEGDAV